MADPILKNKIERAETIAVLGHIHPDGDCVGSALALKSYVTDCWPEKDVRVFLEPASDRFGFLRGYGEIIHEPDPEFRADLAVSLDTAGSDRLGDFRGIFDNASETFLIDHHRTNTGFADTNVIRGTASSACEVLSGFFEEDRISRDTAACLYTGIVTDTGVFKYEMTSKETMRIAGILMEKGIPFGEIIDKAFYMKTRKQQLIMGRALEKSVLDCGGQYIWSVITMEDKAEYDVDYRDMDGIAEQMRLTEGVDCAVLISESEPGKYRLSFRSVKKTDVSLIDRGFGGGGHIRAAGCNLAGNIDEIVRKVRAEVAAQLGEGQEAGC